MNPMLQRCYNVWQTLSGAPAQVPCRVALPPERVNGGEVKKDSFKPKEDYFQVRVNEMYLTYAREWFTIYDPMVFVVSEFIYDKKEEAVPFIVGPVLLEKYGQKTPNGMLFADTRVAGVHPYCGGRLTLSVMLCRITRQQYLRQLLEVVESTARKIDFSTSLESYLKIADAVLDGVAALLGSGNTQPLVGLRKEYDPDAGDQLQEGFFALIDKPEDQVEVDKLWVIQNQLHYGDSEAIAKKNPYQQADYVLYSITQTPKRTDLDTLQFYPLWERVKQDAMIPKADSWDSAKGNMLTLYQNLMLSPDLTPKQATELTEQYQGDMVTLHEGAKKLANLSGEKVSEAEDEFGPLWAKSSDILKL